jgi:RimJ/RimL family protein N-acetyltransferase
VADRVELLPYDDGDYGLSEALETDPIMMRELGGPIDRSRLPEIHRRRINERLYFKIVPDPPGPAAGTIGVWEKELDGETVYETGWMVLPEFQGRGIATAALRLLIDRVRQEAGVESVHAFPSVTNVPSNALCRKFGFNLLGQRDFVYADRTLRCNHWMLLTAPS